MSNNVQGFLDTLPIMGKGMAGIFIVTGVIILAMNPAAALRRGGDCGIDVSKVPLFCSQEPEIDGSPEKMIRVLVTAYLPSGAEVKPVYINGGEKLRPDFAENQSR